jgi:hypothetical protein
LEPEGKRSIERPGLVWDHNIKMDFKEYGNEISGYIKDEEFTDQLSDYWFLKDYALWIWILTPEYKFAALPLKTTCLVEVCNCKLHTV